MATLRFLERLRQTERAPARRGATEPGAVARSILRQLEALLNSRQGCVPIAADYGMPDLSSRFVIFSADAVAKLARDIQRVITRYEPRLGEVAVRSDTPEELSASLRFRIHGSFLGDDGRRVNVAFSMTIGPEGRVDVRR